MKGNELKPRIGIFGRRNNGKSSMINCLTGQEIAIVSEVPGATTDPVRKTMELGGIGPVVWIDTAGIDDVGGLGGMRVEKTMEELGQVDLAVLLLADNQLGEPEMHVADLCRKRGLAMVVVYAQSDRVPADELFLKDAEQRLGRRPLLFNIYDMI